MKMVQEFKKKYSLKSSKKTDTTKKNIYTEYTW